ncbi:NTP pyrophosphohydrolase [Cellulomonas chitinilytica]|uniref:NAD(+) diphosphatase n=1 Tax=Cellulomonas chitinilytica TaxID=398759 RepID=A0A919TY43_9CELL|nr:NAD(+) diphosphatase [Cellulomonas chitinilytica]GIG19313.1 NTP pyrophosphohydrolase [Cellulomonas chitinilytica]
MIVDALPLSRALVDRAAALRADERVVGAALGDARTRVLLVDDGAVATDGDGAVALLAPGDLPHDLSGDLPRDLPGDLRAEAMPDDEVDERLLLLGRDEDGVTYLGLRVGGPHPAPRAGAAADVLVHRRTSTSAHPELPPGLAWTALRTVGADLSALEAGLATTAVALDAWHARHPRCPRCGAATRVTQAGWVRTCTVDGSEHYPRTDPAVIMAVVDDADRLLLGQSTAWAQDRWSTLAGFVEPGESLEHAVRREVLEETGVVVGAVEYRGSQPWPFPASLMLGFHARATTTDVHVDGVELARARWFTRDELRDAVDRAEVMPPGPSSIARALVEDWFGGPLGR